MIGIIGATGFTGQLIARELSRRQVGFVIAGRNKLALKSLSDNLGGVEYRRIDVKDSSTFSELSGCTVIINCAGPFTDFGEAVVQQALQHRMHYLDLTGEQAFIKLVHEKYNEQAKQAGIALIPACAFEYAIGDAGGQLLSAHDGTCQGVCIVYDIHGIHTSPGTRKSIVRAMTAAAYQFSDGKLKLADVDSRHVFLNGKRTSVISFPGGEPVMLPRHAGNLKNVRTYMCSNIPTLLLPALRLTKPLLRGCADFLINNVISSQVPAEKQRKSTKFTVYVIADDGESQTHGISVSGFDPYQLTAVIASGAAVWLADKGPRTTGAITAAMIDDAKLIREITEKAGATWQSF